MNDLVVVPNVFDDFYFNANAIESIRHACKRWGANFFELKKFMHVSNHIHNGVTSNRLWMMKYFTDFDRVLILDPDIIINSNASNIFDELGSYDFAAVHNANPTRMSTYSHLKPVTDFLSGVGVDVLERYIPRFNKQKYYDVYFNGGVYLFNPKKLAPVTDQILYLANTNVEINKILHEEWIFIQNLISGVLSISNLNIKTLDDTWNWIAPDINLEWDLFCGPMHANVYHFTGTDVSKDSMKSYTRWKT
jgi:lipopolysaccharide biosynthesis glycosyltransferase